MLFFVVVVTLVGYFILLFFKFLRKFVILINAGFIIISKTDFTELCTNFGVKSND